MKAGYLHKVVLLVSFLEGASLLAQAQSTTSLFLLGFDPQPLSADVVGVGADGHTTWAIQAGKPTGTEDPSDFPGTVTLVQGPTDVFMTYAVPGVTMGVSCSISASAAAICSSDGETATVPYDLIAVQVGTTAAPGATASAQGGSLTTSGTGAGAASTGARTKGTSGTTSQGASLPSNTGSALSTHASTNVLALGVASVLSILFSS